MGDKAQEVLANLVNEASMWLVAGMPQEKIEAIFVSHGVDPELATRIVNEVAMTKSVRHLVEGEKSDWKEKWEVKIFIYALFIAMLIGSGIILMQSINR